MQDLHTDIVTGQDQEKNKLYITEDYFNAGQLRKIGTFKFKQYRF